LEKAKATLLLESPELYPNIPEKLSGCFWNGCQDGPE